MTDDGPDGVSTSERFVEDGRTNKSAGSEKGDFHAVPPFDIDGAVRGWSLSDLRCQHGDRAAIDAFDWKRYRL